MKPLKTKISITLDDPVLDGIKSLSEKSDRSVSSYINLVLKEHLGRVLPEREDSSSSEAGARKEQ